jgi:hypothetical protein
MIVINTIDNRKFSLNGIPFLKNYISAVRNTKIIIFNCYESKDVLVELTPYIQFSINGISYNTPAEVQAALLDVIYSRATLGGNVMDQDNIDIKKYVNIPVRSSFEQIRAKINALLPYQVGEKQSVWFICTEVTTTSGGFTSPTGKVFKFKAFNQGKGMYGTPAGSGVTYRQYAAADLELMATEGLTPGTIENDPNTQINIYGDLIGQTVSQWLNTMPVPVVIQAQDEGYVLFKGTIDDVSKSYLWIGEPGAYGTGYLQSTISDFQLVDDANPADAGSQDLQDTLAVGSSAAVPEDISIQATGTNGSYSKVDIKKDGTFLWNAQDENGYSSSVGIGNGGYNQYGVGTFFSYFGYGYQFITEQGDVIFSGGEAYKGIQYDQDYSANYVDRSLVDKAYVNRIAANGIPLTGTGENAPVTGDIVFDDDPGIEEIRGLSNISQLLPNIKNFIGFLDGTIMFGIIDTDTGYTTRIVPTKNGFVLTSTDPASRGITGVQDFSANLQALDYVQKKYVDALTADKIFTVDNKIYNKTIDLLTTGFTREDSPFLAEFGRKGVTFYSRIAGVTNDYASYSFNGLTIGKSSENKSGMLKLNPDTPLNNEQGLGLQWLTPKTSGALITDTDLKAALTSRLLASSSVDGPALTGTVSQSILATYFIPANSIGNGLLDIMAKYEKLGVAGTAELRIVKNTLPNLSSGFVQIARVSHTATTLYGPIYRTFEIKDNTIQGWSFGTSGITDNVISTLARSTSSFDTTVDQYIMIVGVLANAADSIKQTAFKMTYNKSL